MKYFVPAALSVIIIAILCTTQFNTFKKKFLEVSEKMSNEGGDNIWDRKYYVKSIARLKQEQIDVVYFCDSTMFTNGDKSQNTIAELLEKDHRLTVLTLASPGFSPAVYKDYIKLLDRTDKTSVVVICINMRSFSRKWAKDYSYKELSSFIGFHNWKPTFHDWTLFAMSKYKDLFEFYINEIHIDAFETDKVNSYFPDESTSAGKESLCDQYLNSYHNNITSAHPVMESIRSVADFARIHRIKVLFYITPLNIGNISEECAPQGLEAINKSIAQVTSLLGTLTGERTKALDLSHALDASHFPEPAYPNEHLNQEGRATVANAIAGALP